MKEKISKLLIFVILASIILAGCGSTSSDMPYDGMTATGVFDSASKSESNGFLSFGSSDYESSNSAPLSPDNSVAMPEIDDELITENFQERKVVYYINTELQTKNLDEALTLIKKNISDCGGYIESETLSNNGSIDYKYQHRHSYLEIRIPSKNLEKFLSGLEDKNLYTISLRKESQDYSEAYYDKETRIANLKIQENRLLELLGSASDVQTMLEIEERLSEIRYSIESLTKEMNIIDSKVEYSTVNLSLSEVVDYDEHRNEPKSFFEEIREAIKDSWKEFVEACQDFIIWLIYAFPALTIFAVVLVILCIISRRFRNKRKVRKNQENKDSE